MERPDLLWSLSQPVSETLRRTLCLQGAALGPHPLVPDDRLDQFAQLVCINCNTFLGWVDCAGERHAAPHIPPSRRPPGLRPNSGSRGHSHGGTQTDQNGGIKPWHPHGIAQDRLIHDTKRVRDRSILFIRIGQCDPLVERKLRLPGRPRGED